MLLILWFLGVTLGNSLLADSSGSPRCVGVFPALMLMAAVGIRYGVPLLLRPRVLHYVVIFALGMGLAYTQGRYYFVDYLPYYNQLFRANRAGPDAFDAVMRASQLSTDTRAFIFSTPGLGDMEYRAMISILNPGMNLFTVDAGKLDLGYIAEFYCGYDRAFFVEPRDYRTIMRLNTYFHLKGPFFSPYDDLPRSEQFALYYFKFDPQGNSLFEQWCQGLAPGTRVREGFPGAREG
jgi:hypothetical protein